MRRLHLSAGVQQPQNTLAHACNRDRPSAAHGLGRQRRTGVSSCGRLRDHPARVGGDPDRLHDDINL